MKHFFLWELISWVDQWNIFAIVVNLFESMYIHSFDVYIVGNIARDLQGFTYSLWIVVSLRAFMNVI